MFPWKALLALAGLGLAFRGLGVLSKLAGRPVAAALCFAGGSALLLKYCGSFVPVLARTQPSRFIVPALVLLSIPIGCGIASLLQKLRLPVAACAGAVALLLLCAGWIQGRPDSIPLPTGLPSIAEFVRQRTGPDDRLMIQTKDFYEPKIMPLVFRREVIGSTFNEQTNAQFLRETLWGKRIEEWSSEGVQEALDRWGVSWVFTCHPTAERLMRAVTGHEGELTTDYSAFHVSKKASSRFWIGSGELRATLNRLDLSELVPKDGLIVLRYRYHPAWKSLGGSVVEQYPVPEDPVGFLALRNPPRSLTLDFDAWAMLHAAWPLELQAASGSRKHQVHVVPAGSH